MAEKKVVAEKTKAKALLTIGYTRLVMDADLAAQVMGLLLQGDIEERENKYDDIAKKSYSIVKPASLDIVALSGFSREAYAIERLTYAAELKQKEGE